MAGEAISGFTIDHVELFVPDRDEAAEWYATVLGCERVRGAEQWAKDPAGPLMGEAGPRPVDDGLRALRAGR